MVPPWWQVQYPRIRPAPEIRAGNAGRTRSSPDTPDSPEDSSSKVSPEKQAAYRATDYCIGNGPDRIVLNIGQCNPLLASVFLTGNVDRGAFITACNPQGTRQSDEANDTAHRELLDFLAGRRLCFVEGSGVAQAGDWPAERSVFVFDLHGPDACEIGRRFRQDAIVWVGPDAVPQLVMLR